MVHGEPLREALQQEAPVQAAPPAWHGAAVAGPAGGSLAAAALPLPAAGTRIVVQTNTVGGGGHAAEPASAQQFASLWQQLGELRRAEQVLQEQSAELQQQQSGVQVQLAVVRTRVADVLSQLQAAVPERRDSGAAAAEAAHRPAAGSPADHAARDGDGRSAHLQRMTGAAPVQAEPQPQRGLYSGRPPAMTGHSLAGAYARIITHVTASLTPSAWCPFFRSRHLLS